jgi:SAM-dependent methyltransferase
MNPYSEFELNYLPHINGKNVSVVDIGCGEGDFLLYLRSLGFEHLRGTEIDSERYMKCKNKGLEVEKVYQLDKWLNGKTFDVVMLRYVIAHFKRTDTIRYLKAIRNSLSSNGVLIVDTSNASMLSSFYMLSNGCEHDQYFTEYSLREIVEKSGFTNIRIFGKKMHSRSIKFLLWKFARSIWISTLKIIFILERGNSNNPTIWTKSIIAICRK